MLPGPRSSLGLTLKGRRGVKPNYCEVKVLEGLNLSPREKSASALTHNVAVRHAKEHPHWQQPLPLHCHAVGLHTHLRLKFGPTIEKSKPLSAGFEPTRVSATDFKSVPLTTRA